MRVYEEHALTAPLDTWTVPTGYPGAPVNAVRGERPPPLAPPAMRLLLAHAVVGMAALIWILPAPWGGLVPVALLAQVVWFRHGLVATVAGLMLGSASGATVGLVLALGDWRRAALAMLLLLLPAMVAWPAGDDSARR